MNVTVRSPGSSIPTDGGDADGVGVVATQRQA